MPAGPAVSYIKCEIEQSCLKNPIEFSSCRCKMEIPDSRPPPKERMCRSKNLPIYSRQSNALFAWNFGEIPGSSKPGDHVNVSTRSPIQYRRQYRKLLFTQINIDLFPGHENATGSGNGCSAFTVPEIPPKETTEPITIGPEKTRWHADNADNAVAGPKTPMLGIFVLGQFFFIAKTGASGWGGKGRGLGQKPQTQKKKTVAFRHSDRRRTISCAQNRLGIFA